MAHECQSRFNLYVCMKFYSKKRGVTLKLPLIQIISLLGLNFIEYASYNFSRTLKRKYGGSQVVISRGRIEYRACVKRKEKPRKFGSF